MSTKKKDFFDWKSDEDFKDIIFEIGTERKYSDICYIDLYRWGYMNYGVEKELEAQVEVVFSNSISEHEYNVHFTEDIFRIAARRLMKVKSLQLENEEEALKFIEKKNLGEKIIKRALYGYLRYKVSEEFMQTIEFYEV